MKIVKQTKDGIGYLFGLLKEKKNVITRAAFWRIPRTSNERNVCLKIGRYNKSDGYMPETLECDAPKSELTLDNDELDALLKFISENYEPFKQGLKRYIPIGEEFDQKNVEHVRAIFNNPDKQQLLDFVVKNDILPEDLLAGLEQRVRLEAVGEFEKMLANNETEHSWQKWFTDNKWVLGADVVEVLDERQIDTANITDYLVEAHDGFIDIIEIKRPEGELKFWADRRDHDNYVPSTDLTKAITQATKYIYEVERETNSVKFKERVGIKPVKPRCVLIFGRSHDWDDERKEAFRILNASYHNLSILSYDHVSERAKRILGVEVSQDESDLASDSEYESTAEDVPF